VAFGKIDKSPRGLSAQRQKLAAMKDWSYSDIWLAALAAYLALNIALFVVIAFAS
jgi:hypothetical protein